MIKRSLETKIVTGCFGLALLLLCNAGFAFYFRIKQLIDNQKWVEHTHQVLETIHNIQQGIQSAEEGRRGYLLTEEARYEKTYINGIQQTKKELNKLQHLTGDNLQQQQRIKELKPLIDERLKIFQDSFYLLKSNKSDRAIQRILTSKGTNVTEQIQVKIAAIAKAEQTLLLQRSKATNTNIYYTIILVGIGYFLSFSLLGGVYYLLKKQIDNRQQAEKALRQTNEQLENKVQERTAELTQSNIALQKEIAERKRVEDSLRQSEERFRRAIVDAPLPIMIHASDGEVLQINRAWTELSGYESEEISTIATWTQKVYGEDHKSINQYIYHLFSLKRRVAEGEYTLTNRSGDRLTWDFHSAPLDSLPDGRLVRITMALDVTERKQVEKALRESEEQLRLALEGANLGMWDYDLVSGQLTWTERCKAIFGLSPDTTITCEVFKNALHPDDREWVNQVHKQVISNREECDIEYRSLWADGTVRWIAAKGRTFYNDKGEPARIVGVVLDISDRKLAEVTLKQAKAELEVRVKERTAALASANHELRLEVIERRQVEAALRESEERWHLALHGSNDGIWDWNVKTARVFFSTRWKEMRGFEDHEIGNSLDEWSKGIHPNDIEWVMQAVADHFAKKTSFFAAEYRVQRKDGSYMWIFDRGQALWDEAGNVVRMAGSETDISDRKRTEEALRQSEAKFRSLSECSPVGIFMTDIRGQCTYTNPRYQAICGCTFDEAVAEGWVQFIHPEDRDGVTRQWSTAVSEGQEFSGEIRYVHKEGTIRFGRVQSAPIFSISGELIGYVGTVEDITDSRAIEKMKNEFISVVSHELRTPLASIRGSLGLLAAGIFKNKPQAAQEMLDIATQETERLVRLVNDILDLERLESDKVKLVKQWCNAATLLQHSIETVQSLAIESNITLSVEPTSVQVWADCDRLLQTLVNLVSNAIKFSPPNSRVTLSAQDQAHQVLFQVKDQGRGIPADKLETIFGRFHQVDASDSRAKEGTGLGLAICRSLVQQHGGKIWAESVLGEGSSFYFTLPKPLD